MISWTKLHWIGSSSSRTEVFDFKEDDLNEAPAKRISSDSDDPHSLTGKPGSFCSITSSSSSQSVFQYVKPGVIPAVQKATAVPKYEISRCEIYSKKNDSRLPGGSGYSSSDCNHDDTVSLNPIVSINFDEVAFELSCPEHNSVKTHKGVADIEPNKIQSRSLIANMRCGSSPSAVDKSVHIVSEIDMSMSGQSPSATMENNVSCDGPSSDDCISGCNLGDGSGGIAFSSYYIDFHGKHYADAVVSFSRSFVDVRCKTIDGNKGTFHVQLDIENLFKIESQWSACYEEGSISIYFTSEDVVEDDGVHNASVSGIRELKFPVADCNWYKKQEAIMSLDLRYKALWRVLLDTGMENCSPLPEGDTIVLTRSYIPNFDKPFEEVIYPKGDPDAVSISKRDVDLLLPETFVNDTIIDFYIKYLKTRQNAEKKTKYHFFNSFFFRKLADMDKHPSDAFDGRAAFQRVHKWTRKVNLSQKDFIFIPVNYNYHWSLIVICYFGEVASYKDPESKKLARVPCILHMDSLRGTHVGLKDLLQSYLLEEWKERQSGACDNLHSNFKSLKFVSLELPQQQNSYDCGLFLLHYVELFLEEVPANFSIYNITSYSKFLQADWFPPGEASMKRTHIERLINGLLDTQFDNCSPSAGVGIECAAEGLKSTHDYENRSGVEMSLLPGSSMRSNHCPKTLGLLLNDLPATASEIFNDSAGGALEGRASHDELKRPLPLIEEEGTNTACFVPTELGEPVYQHLDSIAPETVFPYSSGDFRLEAVHQNSPDDIGSSPVTSGEMLHSEETNGLADISNENGNPFFFKSLPGFSLEANQLSADLAASLEHTIVFSEEQHAAKRMRITPHYL